MRLKWPRAETPTHYIAMGLHEDLDEATCLAVRKMVEFLVGEEEALQRIRLQALLAASRE
jgi:acetamidase/formamidase